MKLSIVILSLFVVSTQGDFKHRAYRHSYSKNTVHSSKSTSSSDSSYNFSIGRNIRILFQDKKGNIWMGTEGEGAYKFDGRKYTHYGKKEGLIGDYVRTINQDQSGNIWFGTNEGILSYNGLFFINHTKKKDLSYRSSSCSFVDSKGNVWFGTRAGLYRFEGYKMSYIELLISETNKRIHLSDYSVYSIYEDKDGAFYFGTEFRGVCKYKNNTFEYINDRGINSGPIRSIYKDKKGLLWFGSNTKGLYSYDGKNLRNLSEEKGLSEATPVQNNNNKPSSLTRIWSITEDIAGNLWIGTIDAGAWRYDGKNITNITTKDGLQNNGVQVIMKDNKGKLWFGTDGGGVSTFDGTKFQMIVRGRTDGC